MIRAILVFAMAALSTGCLGTGALTTKARKFNLSVVENRWGREGLFLGMQVVWIYRICWVLDIFLFNSLEFWSGTNPLTGQGALVDVPAAAVEKMGLNEIDRAQVELVSDTEAKLHLDFRNGDRMAFDVLRHDAEYTVSYRGRPFFTGQIDVISVDQGVANP